MYRISSSNFYLLIFLSAAVIYAQDDGAPAPEESISDPAPDSPPPEEPPAPDPPAPEEPPPPPPPEPEQPQVVEEPPQPDPPAEPVPDPAPEVPVPDPVPDPIPEVPEPVPVITDPPLQPDLPQPPVETIPSPSLPVDPVVAPPPVVEPSPPFVPTPTIPGGPQFPAFPQPAPAPSPPWMPQPQQPPRGHGGHGHGGGGGDHGDHNGGHGGQGGHGGGHDHDHGHNWGHDHNDHGHDWGHGWGRHHHHHHSEEHHNHGRPRPSRPNWSSESGSNGGSSWNGGDDDWMRYLTQDNSNQGCGVFMMILGLCGNNNGLSTNHIQPAGNNIAVNAPGGNWWQQRLGEAGSQKIANPLPPETFGTGAGTGTGTGTGAFTNAVNLPKGMGSFDEPTSSFGGSDVKMPSSSSFSGTPKIPAGTGSFDEPMPASGTGTGTGTGGLKEWNQAGSSFGDGKGGWSGKPTDSFGEVPSVTQPPKPIFPQQLPHQQQMAEKVVPCKSSEFVGFSNGHMRFRCDCGSSGISFQEDQCTMRTPALRAPIISGRRPSNTFDFLG